MKTIRFEEIDYTFNLEETNIITISFESSNTYRKLLKDLINKESNIVYSNYGKILSFDKYYLVLENLIEFDLNTKKNLNNLYKKIIDKLLDQNDLANFEEINEKLLNFISNFSEKLSFSVDYNSGLDLMTVFTALDFKINIDKEEYINTFISYLSTLVELTKIHIVFTNNLFSYINNREVDYLVESLQKLGIIIINISRSVSIKHKLISSYIYDEDNCLI